MDASTIILGFTGPIGSGCSFISNFLPKVADKEYKYIKLSNIIRDILKSEGVNEPTVEQLQDKGNQLRGENGRGFLIEKLIELIDKESEQKKFSGIIVDGIKNTGEVQTLRQFPFFFLFSIHSDFQTRQERVKTKFSSDDAFFKADERDRLEKDDLYGQQVKKCNYHSDIIIINEDNFPNVSINKEKKAYVLSIYNQYVKSIENLQDGIHSVLVSPSTDELCMTIAYAQSKMSSCIKRKVGTIIIDDVESRSNSKEDAGVVGSLPVIVSSGYNEVPIGSHKCAYHPDFQMCYRDHLQESHAKKIKHCPNCGKKIEISVECPFCKTSYQNYTKYCKKCQKEIEDIFKCPDCQSEIFKEFLPGGKETPGKLLDMCRALHAEENALLRLATKVGSHENLKMYVTTQPCNLCANKIVSAGIKTIVFDEPYPMKEASTILTNGGVKAIRFQGVKSTAYFKLY